MQRSAERERVLGEGYAELAPGRVLVDRISRQVVGPVTHQAAVGVDQPDRIILANSRSIPSINLYGGHALRGGAEVQLFHVPAPVLQQRNRSEAAVELSNRGMEDVVAVIVGEVQPSQNVVHL